MMPSGRPATAGTFIVEFQGQRATGLTGAEVAALLESGANADARVYRIHRVYPDGRMELVGVPHHLLQQEDGFFFYRRDRAAARADLVQLRRLASFDPPPCKAQVQLAEFEGDAASAVVALIHPAEFSSEMSAWLIRIGFNGGDSVECGVSQVAGFRSLSKTVIEQDQLWPTPDGAPDRSS